MSNYEYIYQVLFEITKIHTDDIDNSDYFEKEKPYKKEMTIRKSELVEKLEDLDIFQYWRSRSHKYKYSAEDCVAKEVVSLKKILLFFNDETLYEHVKKLNNSQNQ